MKNITIIKGTLTDFTLPNEARESNVKVVPCQFNK